MNTVNRRSIHAKVALLATAMLLVIMCHPIVSSAANWWTYPVGVPSRDQVLRFAGYSALPTNFCPLQYDSGNMGFDVGVMYEPLFGQNLGTNTQINWLGKSIFWVNSTAIEVVLRNDTYWVQLTDTGPVYYRPITVQDVNYTFWLYGGFYSSGSFCTYLNGLRDRLENNGTNLDLNSFVVLNSTAFVVRLNPIFANSDVAFRAISKNVLILPYDVWTQVLADPDYASNPTLFANDWAAGRCPDDKVTQTVPQAWLVASGQYLPWYHNTVPGSEDTKMKRNDLWWGKNDTDFGRLPRPLFIENYLFAGNANIPAALEAGDIDWDGNYVADLQTITKTYLNIHTYLWNLPFFPDGSALCMVPNHREYPVGEPWLARAIAMCINYTDVSAVDSYYLRTPSVLLLPVDDGIARQLVNTTIENQYQPVYDPVGALALLNQHSFISDGSGGLINGMRYTNTGPTAQELATYPEYSSQTPAATTHTPIPTVGKSGSGWANDQWGLIDIQGWTDVNIADEVVCDAVRTALGINLQSVLLGPAGWSPEYVSRMDYGYGNQSFDFADYCMEGALNNNLFERYTQFFTGSYEGCWNHYGSYRNATLVSLIALLDTVPAGSQAQQSIANQIETIVGQEMPIIPEGGHPNWYIWSDKYWIGFADQYSNPLLPSGPYIGRANEAALHLGIWRLHPKNFDLNGDAKVDVKDITMEIRAFGTTPGFARWNTICDIDDNRKIDIKDVAKVAHSFGTTYVYP